MAKYSKINFNDIDNSSTSSGVEAYFSRRHIDSKELGVSLFRYPANFKADMAHSHKEQEEVYVIVNGSGKILLNDEVLDLKKWDVVRIAPEVVRAFRAGSDGLEVIAVGGQKPEGGDGVRHEALWPSGS